jgi:hypothetical protein
MKNDLTQNNSSIVIYQDEQGNIKLDVRFENETVWLTQRLIAELFGTTPQNITLHLKSIFDEAELIKDSTCKKFLQVQKEGNREVSREVEFYNLDVILAISYRMNSKRATQFRIWATQRLKEYIVKGFAIDEERLKNPDQPFDHFEELERKIQDIRTSEKRFYRKITDIYALSVDYDSTDEMSINFFKTVQNKLHYAITGQIAPELIKSRANSNKKNMGLTTYRGAIPRKDEILIAKNYYNEQELLALNNLTEQYLIFAQGQAMRKIAMRMQDWIEKLNGFLTLNDRDILKDAGKVSHELAKEIAENEYQKWHTEHLKQEASKDNDFDKFVKKVEGSKKVKKK